MSSDERPQNSAQKSAKTKCVPGKLREAIDDLERDLERLLRVLEECLRESNHAVRRRCGSDISPSSTTGLSSAAALVFASSALSPATTCVVPFRAPAKKSDFDIPAAFELLERRRIESEAATGIGVVFGVPRDQPGFRVSRRGASMLVSFAEFLSQLLQHDHAALRIAMAKDGEDAPVEFLRRRAIIDGGETEVDDAIAHVMSWAKSNEGGSLVVIGPRGSGKTTLIDEVRRQTARARLDANYVVPVFVDRTTSSASRREKLAMEEGIFVRAEKVEKQLHLAKLDYFAQHRILAEAEDDVRIDKSMSPGDPTERISILRLVPTTPADVLAGLRLGLDANARTWFDAAIDRSQDLRDLACRLASFSPMLEAAKEASSSFDSTPKASVSGDSDAVLDRYTRVLVYDYVDRAIRNHLHEKFFAWQGDGTVASLEDAALTSFTSSGGKGIDGFSITFDRNHGALESWLRVDGGERLDVDQGPIGYGAAIHFASELVRDSLLVRRLVRDERLGKKETRDRLRLPSALEHLVEREISRWSK